MTHKEVRSLRRVGLHAVAGPVPGLALQITQTPGNPLARSWVPRAMVAGSRRALGLGPYPGVSLAAARDRAEAMHRDIRDNKVPSAIKRQQGLAAAKARSMTFAQTAEQYIAERRDSWKNLKHAQQWESPLKTYAYPVIEKVEVADVDKAMVLKIIKPIWTTKNETANRVRDRIKLVLNWAKAHCLRDGENPVEWRGHLEHALAAPAECRSARTSPHCLSLRWSGSYNASEPSRPTSAPRPWNSPS